MNLLERDHCFDQLSELLSMARTGHGRTALIGGEAGIGKTALVEQFVRQQDNTVRRLWGACEALYTPRPLGPLYDIASQAQSGLSTLMRDHTERATLFSVLLDDLLRSPLPTIMVFEDVHWADEATLDLIKFLGKAHLPASRFVSRHVSRYRTRLRPSSVVGDR
jgi:predicted ATPase